MEPEGNLSMGVTFLTKIFLGPSTRKGVSRALFVFVEPNLNFELF